MSDFTTHVYPGVSLVWDDYRDPFTVMVIIPAYLDTPAQACMGTGFSPPTHGKDPRDNPTEMISMVSSFLSHAHESGDYEGWSLVMGDWTDLAEACEMASIEAQHDEADYIGE